MTATTMQPSRFVMIGAVILVGAAEPPPVFPPEAAGRLATTITQIMDHDDLPSVLVDIDVPGHAPYQFVRGRADITTDTARSAEQPFRIASLTKTFTATAILLLADRGKLRVLDPISRWYPDFPHASTITVDDLLRMRSGIVAESDQKLAADTFDHPLAPAPTLAARMAAAARQSAEFSPPNRRGVYVNLNYFILGGIIERVSGQTAGQFITENIIDKLGLRQTMVPQDEALPGGLHGYGRDRAAVLEDKTAFNPALAGAAGDMISSVQDLRRYVRVLCTGGLLAPATQVARMRGQALDGTTTQYGEGLITGPLACGHSGTIPGFATDMYYFPAFDATAIVSVNRLDRDDKLLTPPIVSAAYSALEAQFRPGQYCRRVERDDVLHALTDALQPGAQAAFNVAAAAANGVWRCDGGQVLACITGANLPCGKLNADPTSPAANRWCAEHPQGDVPDVATGSDTLWRWSCISGHAVHTQQRWTLDGSGFASELWKPLDGR